MDQSFDVGARHHAQRAVLGGLGGLGEGVDHATSLVFALAALWAYLKPPGGRATTSAADEPIDDPGESDEPAEPGDPTEPSTDEDSSVDVDEGFQVPDAIPWGNPKTRETSPRGNSPS